MTSNLRLYCFFLSLYSYVSIDKSGIHIGIRCLVPLIRAYRHIYILRVYLYVKWCDNYNCGDSHWENSTAEYSFLHVLFCSQLITLFTCKRIEYWIGFCCICLFQKQQHTEKRDHCNLKCTKSDWDSVLLIRGFLIQFNTDPIRVNTYSESSFEAVHFSNRPVI